MTRRPECVQTGSLPTLRSLPGKQTTASPRHLGCSHWAQPPVFSRRYCTFPGPTPLCWPAPAGLSLLKQSSPRSPFRELSVRSATVLELESSRHASLAYNPNPRMGRAGCPSLACCRLKGSHLAPSATYPRPVVRWVVEILASKEGIRRPLPSRYC